MSVLNPSGRLIAAALASTTVIVITAGCSASSSSGSTSNAGAQRQPAAAGGDRVASGAGPMAQEPAHGGTAGKPGADPPAQLATDSRALIFTGTVTIRVSDVGRAAADVSALATSAGGFVGGDDRTSDKDRSQARLTLRVPSARFTGVVDGVSKLGANGRDESRQLSTEDVTDQVTDLNARIATGQASVDRVRELLAKAQNIGDIVSLESELSRREADLESLKSRKSKLDDLTTLSTLTAVILGPQAAAKAPAHRSATGFSAGFERGWHAFAGSLRILLTVLGALLPWLLGLGLPALAALWAVRRLRRPRPRTAE
ncbi:DUF4349 domain-containing protein [Planosporangium thailandense]|uniref:DUF4349 domain-containing protein n=1 Tax=Planosporangium thailandense TaxID=765197 RepID=A0ABX0XW71_9ACTN|nr:DUF4349 domain-containing protein [Planosporangium thailandense]NJC69470.1 DUF4349 domain-containing protein [Planosporangium thailandense]